MSLKKFRCPDCGYIWEASPISHGINEEKKCKDCRQKSSVKNETPEGENQ